MPRVVPRTELLAVGLFAVPALSAGREIAGVVLFDDNVVVGVRLVSVEFATLDGADDAGLVVDVVYVLVFEGVVVLEFVLTAAVGRPT